MPEISTDYVVQTPDGAWRVIGTRVSLDSIVHAYWNGRQPETIAADFPTVSLEQIHGAIAYYLHNKEAVDKYLTERDADFEKRRAEDRARPNHITREMLLARKNSIDKNGSK